MAGSKGGRGGRGTSTYTLATQAQTTTGGTITLPIPLKYGEKDPYLGTTLRQNIDAWETKREKSKIEFGMLYKADGQTVGPERRGGANGVTFNTLLYRQSDAWTHIHPRGKGEEGLLGGTFSEEDLSDFGKQSPPTARAAAAEGTYSITRQWNFDQNGFQSWWSKDAQQPITDHRTRMRQLAKDVKAGNRTITRDEYYRIRNESFNRALIECHDLLLANQKRFGYFYTLEKRR